MARLLKARYFKNVDIMEARRGLRSSFIWQSILWSRDLIGKGLQWMVGDGEVFLPFKMLGVRVFYLVQV